MKADYDETGDCYVRVAGGQLRDWQRARVVPGSVAFVDVAAEGEDFETIRASMRAIPAGALVGAAWVLIRLPDDLRHLGSEDGPPQIGSLGDQPAATEMLESLAHDLQARLVEQGLTSPPNVGLVRFPIGQPPEVGWSNVLPAAIDAARLLHRARRSELRALMVTQEAISTPTSYHYRLPSGHHSASFVRVGDLFRDLRSAFVLSTWLRAGLRTDRSNVVVLDTGTITPIAIELDAAMRVVCGDRLQVLALDEYPESRFEYLRAFTSVTGPPGAPGQNVICILSVTSTKGMRGRAVDALNATVGPGAWRLEPLISRGDIEATAVPLITSTGAHEAWLALADLQSQVTTLADCRLCQDPDRARLVTIDPRSFAAKSLPEPQLLMPTVGDGAQNRSLWNLYDRIQPERAANRPPSVSLLGRLRLMETDKQAPAGAYFEPSMLVHHGLGSLIAERLDEIERTRPLTRSTRSAEEWAAVVEAARNLRGIDLVVIDRDDAAAFGRSLGEELDDSDVTQRLSSELAVLGRHGVPDVFIVEGDGTSRSEHLAEVARVRAESNPRILLFTFGLRLGVTLQRLLVDVHNAWRVAGYDPVIKGLVIHAHPEDSRAWTAVRNAFWREDRSALAALWLTYLPHRSPLDDERVLLEAASTSDPPEAVAAVILRRLAELRLPGPEAGSVRPFWSAGEPALRRTSYYGDELHDRTTLAAVGAAMQRARLIHRPHDSPYWFRFDVPKIFRSYFDGLIHVAALRWMRPHEGWWGATENEQKLLVAEVKHQAPSDWPLVLAELLLASAQGKVPSMLNELLQIEADAALESTLIDQEAQDWIRLGRYLIDSPPG